MNDLEHGFPSGDPTGFALRAFSGEVGLDLAASRKLVRARDWEERAECWRREYLASLRTVRPWKNPKSRGAGRRGGSHRPPTHVARATGDGAEVTRRGVPCERMEQGAPETVARLKRLEKSLAALDGAWDRVSTRSEKRLLRATLKRLTREINELGGAA